MVLVVVFVQKKGKGNVEVRMLVIVRDATSLDPARLHASCVSGFVEQSLFHVKEVVSEVTFREVWGFVRHPLDGVLSICSNVKPRVLIDTMMSVSKNRQISYVCNLLSLNYSVANAGNWYSEVLNVLENHLSWCGGVVGLSKVANALNLDVVNGSTLFKDRLSATLARLYPSVNFALSNKRQRLMGV